MNLLKNTVWIPLFLNHLQFSHHAELEGTMRQQYEDLQAKKYKLHYPQPSEINWRGEKFKGLIKPDKHLFCQIQLLAHLNIWTIKVH